MMLTTGCFGVPFFYPGARGQGPGARGRYRKRSRVPIRPVVRLPTAVFVPCCGRDESRRDMLPENEIGINRDDSLPGKGKNAECGIYDRIRRIDESTKISIVSLYTRSVARTFCVAGNMSVGCPLPGRASSRDTTYPIPVNKFRRDDALPQQGTRTAVGSRTTIVTTAGPVSGTASRPGPYFNRARCAQPKFCILYSAFCIRVPVPSPVPGPRPPTLGPKHTPPQTRPPRSPGSGTRGKTRSRTGPGSRRTTRQNPSCRRPAARSFHAARPYPPPG